MRADSVPAAPLSRAHSLRLIRSIVDAQVALHPLGPLAQLASLATFGNVSASSCRRTPPLRVGQAQRHHSCAGRGRRVADGDGRPPVHSVIKAACPWDCPCEQ